MVCAAAGVAATASVPTRIAAAPKGQFGGARDVRPYTEKDIRFTTKGDTLYAFFMGWPGAEATITSVTPEAGKAQKVELLGGGELQFTQDAGGLKVKFPAEKIGDHAHALKISGLKLS